MTAPAEASAAQTPEDPQPRDGATAVDAERGGDTDLLDGDVVDELDDLDDSYDADPDVAATPLVPASVLAVLVCCDGERWLPRVLSELAGQTRPPDLVVAVDTGSTDGSRALVAQALGEDAVLDLPRGTGFGAAVEAALRAADPRWAPAESEVPWLWLLHDDSAPAPDALERLVTHVGRNPAVAVAGSKARGWRNRRALLEVGLTIAGGGSRDTGLEPQEQDQGQYDVVRPVLAVGTAGMLVRRDVLEHLGGFDPLLPAFGDDLDLCWRVRRAGHEVVCVPTAVVHHVQAARNARRPVPAAGRHAERPHLLERRGAMYLLAANRPRWQLPFVIARLVLGGLVRAVVYLLGKVPSFAADELRAVAWLLTHPGALLRAQRERRRTAVVPHREVGRLMARPGSQARAGLETFAAAATERVAEATGATQARQGRRSSVLETGPTAEEAEDYEGGGSHLLRSLLLRPGVLVTFGLLALTAVATRSLWGSGRLAGGALLPAHGSAADLARVFAGSWHPVGSGSGTPSHPYLAVLAVLATPLGGSARVAVDLLLLGCIPLAGISAYACARRLTSSPVLRAWGAVTYALLPACTGAVASGRIGTAGAVVLLPPLALLTARALLGDDVVRARRATWGAAALLAVTTALVPLAWPIAAGVAVVLAAAQRRAGPALRALTLAAVPALVLAPWSWHLLREPRLLALEPGLLTRDIVDAEVPPYAVLLLHPGGPGMFPVLVSAGLVAAGLAGLLRSQRREVVLTAWTAVVVATVAGLVIARIRVTGVAGAQLPPWPGFATAVAGLGLLAAAVVAADRALERLAGYGFGWRQPVAGAVAVAAAVIPVFAGAAWVARGAGDPLERQRSAVVPAFVEATVASPDRPRTLVLQQTDSGRVRYTLLRSAGARLGDAEPEQEPRAGEVLDRVVADLTSGRGGTDVQTLAGFGTRYVLLLGKPSDALVGDLDSVPGLARVGAPVEGVLWSLTGPTGRVRLLGGGPGAVVPSAQVGVDAPVPAAAAARTVALAEAADPRWRATLDGRPLASRTVDGWAQGFTLPPEGGRLVIEHEDPRRLPWLAVAAATLVLALLLALPGIRVAGTSDDEAP